jgi:hypothetical protein
MCRSTIREYASTIHLDGLDASPPAYPPLTKPEVIFRWTLSLARVLLENAIEAKQHSTAKDCLSIIASLTKAHETSLLKNGQLFSAGRAHQMLASMGDVIVDVLKAEIPDRYEAVCDRISDLWTEKLFEEKERAKQATLGATRRRLGRPPEDST